MSLDNQYEPVANVNTLPPKKSGGALKWILGGCGCLGLMAAICIGGLFLFGYSKFDEAKQEARSFVEGSTVLQEQLGRPITIDSDTLSLNPDFQPIFGFDVTGPDGSGFVTVNMNNDGDGLVLGESVLNFNGETFDLNAEDEFKEPEVEGLDF